MEQIDNLINTAIEEIEQQALLEDDATTTKKKYVKNKYIKGRVKSHLPHDEEYFNKYYNENLSVKVVCDICSSCVAKGHLRRHKTSKKCLKKIVEARIDAILEL